MSMLKLTNEQSDAIYMILVEHAGARLEDHEMHSFTHHMTDEKHPCMEYRFQGSLGFGGKLRNNGNRDYPYVDCYSENLTPERQAIIDRTNAALETMFAPSTSPAP